MVLVNFDGWSDNQKQVYNAATIHAFNYYN